MVKINKNDILKVINLAQLEAIRKSFDELAISIRNVKAELQIGRWIAVRSSGIHPKDVAGACVCHGHVEAVCGVYR
ncbi:MAG: hypothetical protein V1827_02560 [Candidatus Micrarchaeota archaeon]